MNKTKGRLFQFLVLFVILSLCSGGVMPLVALLAAAIIMALNIMDGRS